MDARAWAGSARGARGQGDGPGTCRRRSHGGGRSDGGRARRGRPANDPLSGPIWTATSAAPWPSRDDVEHDPGAFIPGGETAPGGGVAAKSALLDAPLRPLRKQPQRRVGMVGQVFISDQLRRHLDAVRRAGVARALVRMILRSPLAKDGADGLGRCIGQVVIVSRGTHFWTDPAGDFGLSLAEPAGETCIAG